jgi:hypothetical protein
MIVLDESVEESKRLFSFLMEYVGWYLLQYLSKIDPKDHPSLCDFCKSLR